MNMIVKAARLITGAKPAPRPSTARPALSWTLSPKSRRPVGSWRSADTPEGSCMRRRRGFAIHAAADPFLRAAA